MVTDKEKGLVPAVTRVFPKVPYQYCQTHYLKNCAKPLAADLTALQASVRRRADAVREVAKLVESSERPKKRRGPEPEPEEPEPVTTEPAVPTPSSSFETPSSSLAASADIASPPPEEVVKEVELVREVCELVRLPSSTDTRW